MPIPKQQPDPASHPQTRCPNCQTVFEIAPELLASSDTRVRCGECLSIFDALEGLRSDSRAARELHRSTQRPPSEPSEATLGEEAGAAALAGLANDTAALDVTYSDFDLFSEDAELPEIAYFDQTRDTPEFDFDSVELEDDETFSDTLFVNDVTINADVPIGELNAPTRSVEPAVDAERASLAPVDFETDVAPREPLVFRYRDADEPAESPAESHPGSQLASSAEPDAHAQDTDGEYGTDTNAQVDAAATRLPDAATHSDDEQAVSVGAKPPRRWPVRILLALLLLALVVALYAWPRRDRLHNDPLARPVLEVGCSVLGCEVPARVALDELTVLRRNVYSHPTIDNALVIEVSFRNNADFEQRYPRLIVRLTDRTGRLVASRDFLPREYLSDVPVDGVLGAGERVNVSLEVTDPGSNARSFELNFGEY